MDSFRRKQNLITVLPLLSSFTSFSVHWLIPVTPATVYSGKKHSDGNIIHRCFRVCACVSSLVNLTVPLLSLSSWLSCDSQSCGFRTSKTMSGQRGAQISLNLPDRTVFLWSAAKKKVLNTVFLWSVAKKKGLNMYTYICSPASLFGVGRRHCQKGGV